MNVIVGAGSIGKKILDKYCTELDECAFYDNDRRKWGKEINGIKVLTLDEFLEVIKNDENKIIVASERPSLYAFLKDVIPQKEVYMELNDELELVKIDSLENFLYDNAMEVGCANLEKHKVRAQQLKNTKYIQAYEHAMNYIEFKENHLRVPEISAIEFTNNCNLRCPNCPNSTLHATKGYMSDDVFYESLKYMPPYQSDTVAVHGLGEPLLHPKLIEYLTEMMKRKINICMSTNGILLNEELGEKILDIYRQLDKSIFYISFHTEKSVENWLKFVQLIDNTKIEGMYFAGQVLEHNLDEVHKWLKEVGVNNPYEHPYIRHITSHSWAGNVEGRRKEYSEIEVNNRIRNCSYLRRRKVCIKWDGTVRNCCYDSEATYKCGSVFEFENADVNPHGYELCRYCDPDWTTGYQ